MIINGYKIKPGADDIPISFGTEFYNIVKCKQYIRIGCEIHTPEEWSNFTDAEIDKMDKNALELLVRNHLEEI